MRIEEIGEFGLIWHEAESLTARDPELKIGIGDDAAVFASASDLLQVATTDMLVEGIHFNLDWIDPYRLGWKAITVNLSDIAAMGALPGSALISIAMPHATDVAFVDALYSGMDAACRRYGASIAGGDTVATPDGVILNVAIVGRVEPHRLALRRGAKPGDNILVTGTLGDSAAGLALLKAGHRPDSQIQASVGGIPWLLERHLAPEPRLAEARAAVSTGGVHAMMDISDGLAGDIRHICAAGGVGACIEEELLPISDACLDAARFLNADPIIWALSGGEDYELLIAASPDDTNNLISAVYESTGTSVTVVGEIKEKGLVLKSSEGEKELSMDGYHHF